jgi:hypothetical protein
MNLSKSISLGLLLLGVSLGTFSQAQDEGTGDQLDPIFCGEFSAVLDTEDLIGERLDLYTVVFQNPNPNDVTPINQMWNERYDWLLWNLEQWAPNGLCRVPPDTCQPDEDCFPILDEWGIFYIEGPQPLPDGMSGWTLYFEGIFGWHCTNCIKKIA